MDSYTTLDIFVADCIVADIHRSLVQIRLEGILYFLTFLNAELFERIYTTYSTIQKMFRPIHLQKNILNEFNYCHQLDTFLFNCAYITFYILSIWKNQKYYNEARVAQSVER